MEKELIRYDLVITDIREVVGETNKECILKDFLKMEEASRTSFFQESRYLTRFFP